MAIIRTNTTTRPTTVTTRPTTNTTTRPTTNTTTRPTTVTTRPTTNIGSTLVYVDNKAVVSKAIEIKETKSGKRYFYKGKEIELIKPNYYKTKKVTFFPAAKPIGVKPPIKPQISKVRDRSIVDGKGVYDDEIQKIIAKTTNGGVTKYFYKGKEILPVIGKNKTYQTKIDVRKLVEDVKMQFPEGKPLIKPAILPPKEEPITYSLPEQEIETEEIETIEEQKVSETKPEKKKMLGMSGAGGFVWGFVATFVLIGVIIGGVIYLKRG